MARVAFSLAGRRGGQGNAFERFQPPGCSHLQPGLYVTWIPLLVPTLRSGEKEEEEEETTQSEKYFLTL